MNFRRRLLLFFLLIVLVSSSVLAFLAYSQARRMLREQMEATAGSIAITAASLIDANVHLDAARGTNENTVAHQALVKTLRQVRDANRRSDVYVKFVYTLVADPQFPTNVLFVVDAEEPGPDKSRLGDPYKFKGKQAEPVNFNTLQVQPGFIEDQWGTWLTAFAPIRTADGKSVAVVGVDISAADVQGELRRLLRNCVLALLVSALLATGLAVRIAKHATRPLAQVRDAAMAIGRGELTTRVEIQSKDEFAEVGHALNEMAQGLQQRDLLKGTLVRYMSSQVTDRILRTGQVPDLLGERRRVTVLFADVRGFTSLAEQLPPEIVVELLNDYFEAMVDVISKHESALNKFLGDGMMTVFGALSDDTHQEENAINAALAMQRALDAHRQRLGDKFPAQLRIGIGIHSGLAIVGNVGTKLHMEFTAIGDTVNLAARLESASKELGDDIIVSEAAQSVVAHLFKFHPLGTIKVKGREAPVSVFGVQPLA